MVNKCYMQYVALCLLLQCISACSGQNDSDREDKPSLTPEQAECIQNAARTKMDYFIESTEKSTEAMLAGKSTIGIAIESRRTNESLCLMQAKCYGLEEPFLSFMFESCLEDLESSNGDDQGSRDE